MIRTVAFILISTALPASASNLSAVIREPGSHRMTVMATNLALKDCRDLGARTSQPEDSDWNCWSPETLAWKAALYEYTLTETEGL